ncbi:IS110 family transposase [Streptomyces sp. NPDC050255]|uniref:IS110 family transposase n=1 Tax=Streptomyces sp. NPDC050255 TaxID=3365606 RepID=UPI0037A514EA
MVLDAEGARLLSRRVLNDETALMELISDVLALSGETLWAVDIKDAFVIADQARMRKDLGLLRPGDEIAVDLRTLTARRTDLVNDRTRQINRLRAQLLEIFPALERALNLSKKGPVVLLAGYQTPAAIRRSGVSRIGTWLKNRKVKNAVALAETVVEAAHSQHTALPGEKLAAAMVARLAKGVMALDAEIAELDALVEVRFQEHPHSGVIRSLPGMGALLGAEFIAATGGDMAAFGTPDRLASFAGLAPVPRDSGRVSGNMRRPRRYHRGLLRAFYLSSMPSLRSCPALHSYYWRKRNEGKGHKQALLALARRRANVLWAMIRDGACYQSLPTVTPAA